jgi:hypothetical protein
MPTTYHLYLIEIEMVENREFMHELKAMAGVEQKRDYQITRGWQLAIFP